MNEKFESAIDFRIEKATEKLNKYIEYLTLKKEKWNQVTPLYSEYLERYFFSREDLIDFITDENIIKPDRLMLFLCEPMYLSEIDDDYWMDELPEDGELPDEVQIAVNNLNSVIRLQGASCYYPTNKAVEVVNG